MERLQKVIAAAGVCSRRHAEDLIIAGKVKVNGEVVRQLGIKVDPEHDKIEVNGKVVKPQCTKIYLLLNKPRGYVTTVFDPQGRRTVMDLVKSCPHRLFPVGRLDYDTEGILLLTNDGRLTFGLTHPKHEIPKTYEALVQGIPLPEKLQNLREGVVLEDGLTAPASVELVKTIGKQAVLHLTIHEGRNRQVRRMCAAIGHPVVELKRIGYAFLTLKGVKEGEYRHLTQDEVAKLKKLLVYGGAPAKSPNP